MGVGWKTFLQSRKCKVFFLECGYSVLIHLSRDWLS